VNYAHLLQMVNQRGFTAGGFQPMAHGTGRAPGMGLDAMLAGRGMLGNPADLHRMTRRMAAGGNGLLSLLSAG
jgi:hypothetical protein